MLGLGRLPAPHALRNQSAPSRREAMPGLSRPAIAVVGVGALGRHHARVIRDLEGVSLFGVFDIDPARNREVGEALGVRVCSSLDEALAGSDAVVVATSTNAHEEVACAAIGRDLHVFVEKPLADSLANADRILDAAEKQGVVVQAGHVERFNPVVVAARPYMDHPLFLESHRLARFSPRSLDVAVVSDLMIHDLDLVCTLTGDAEASVLAAGAAVLSPYADVAHARVSFEKGAVANLTASRISERRVRKLRVWQSSGYVSLDLAAGEGHFYRLKDGANMLGEPPYNTPARAEGLESVVERIPIRGNGVEPLVAELASFRDAVRGLAPPAVSGRDGRKALGLSLAVERQIKEHVAHTRSATS